MRRRSRRSSGSVRTFHEFDTDSSAMVVLEGDKPLGADAHKFYDEMVRRLEQDKKHVEHVQDFWGDTLTAAGSQSSDGKAAYVQVFLAGNQGSALANEGVGAIRDIVEHMQAAAGCQGLCHRRGAAHLRSVRRGQQGDREGHRDHHRRDRGDVVLRLPLHPHDAARAGHGPRRNVRRPRNRRLSWQRRVHRAVDIRDEPAHVAGDRRRNGLRDIFRRPLPGSARRRRGYAKRPSTPCFTARPISSWVRA